MQIRKTHIEGVLILEPQIFNDERGYFYESYNKRYFEKEIFKTAFVQDNQSKSVYGVIRGLHFQKPPFAQSKLIRCVKGTILDVAVDIRKGSPSFGKHIAVELSEDNHLQLFIPRGFAHGFAVLSQEAISQYKCDNYYAPHSEAAILWNDPDIDVDWKIPADKIILSEKDRKNPLLKNIDLVFNYYDDLYAENNR